MVDGNGFQTHGLLSERCWRRLFAYTRPVTTSHEEAAELIAEALARAWTAQPGAHWELSADQVIPFLREVCREWVSLKRWELSVDVQRLEDRRSADAELSTERAEKYEEVKGWLWELPTQQRHAVWFHLLLVLTLDETAAAMSISLSTAKTHYYRGVAALRQRARIGLREPP